MPYNLVSTHHSLQPVKYPKAYRQHQDRVNYLLWLSIHGHHLPPVDPPLSNMNHHHSALNNLRRCSPGMNAIRYYRTMLQPPMLFSIRLLFFEHLIQQEPHNALYYEEVQCVQKTSISMLRSSFNTSLKQMTSLDDLQDYLDWTYQNTFGVYETCGLPTPENKTSWP